MWKNKKGMTRFVVLSCLAYLAYYSYICESNERSNTTSRSIISASTDRSLTIDLGNGNCEWQPPLYDVPEEIDFYKTAIVGFPSGDKRMIFVQMEALTNWAAKDEWDFEFLGMSNNPFIKANYPHHEGIWGWEDAADQVVMMIRNIRRSMVEYHDILWDIGYAKTWDQANMFLDNLYIERPPMEDFLAWRDLRVLDEVHWYGWFIDYWMEGGLLRDIFTHKITTPEHWNMLMMPTVYPKSSITYEKIVGDQVVIPSYDPHCIDDVSGGCEPVAVISAEKLSDYTEGPAETRKIAQVLMNNEKMAKWVIAEEAWYCVWEELIVNRKGLRTIYDRPGFVEADYNFSAEMLEGMLHELDRLIAKYSSDEWNTKETANRVVELLTWHRGLIQTELDEVNSGTRVLTDNDILGPKERIKRKVKKLEDEIFEKTGDKDQAKADARHLAHRHSQEKKDYTEYFEALNEALHKRRREKNEKDSLERGEILRRHLSKRLK
ncbi:hypothetical protein CTEN210_02250 [Chaetoceros tenuissimus]|uniref:Uncharacterized protein n=1 Tax=Chaetoceros tenuissimus TaxID=426638 RepID=A0AAD3CH86_9STRA|nr:hypothetical protein CTEN210_02250 [Chaetoceros tenuissimus]